MVGGPLLKHPLGKPNGGITEGGILTNVSNCSLSRAFSGIAFHPFLVLRASLVLIQNKFPIVKRSQNSAINLSGVRNYCEIPPGRNVPTEASVILGCSLGGVLLLLHFYHWLATPQTRKVIELVEGK